MLFTDLYEIFPAELTNEEIIEYVQSAYYLTVPKFRLDPVVLPVMVAGSRIRISDFDHKLNLVSTNSEVAIKQIHSFVGLDIETVDQSERAELGTAKIGHISETDYGFDTDDFAATNDSHGEDPVLYWSGTDVICTNLTNFFFLMLCYPYPYFCMHNEDNQFETEHRYDIQWMIDKYTADNLVIDDTLGCLVSIKALSLYFGDNFDINKEAIKDKFVLDVINIYNNFGTTKYTDTYEHIGTLEAHLE